MEVDRTRIGAANVEPCRAFSHLPLAIDQEGVVLTGIFPGITVVAQQPLAATEDHEMVGVGMDVGEPDNIGDELAGRKMSSRRTALEYHEGFVSRPTGAGRYDSHVLEMAERRQPDGA